MSPGRIGVLKNVKSGFECYKKAVQFVFFLPQPKSKIHKNLPEAMSC